MVCRLSDDYGFMFERRLSAVQFIKIKIILKEVKNKIYFSSTILGLWSHQYNFKKSNMHPSNLLFANKKTEENILFFQEFQYFGHAATWVNHTFLLLKF